MTLARFPKSGTVPITTVVSPQVFKCSALVGKTLQGATAFARSEHWTWETQLVSSFDAGTGQVTFAGKPINTLKVNWGAWFNNQKLLEPMFLEFIYLEMDLK